MWLSEFEENVISPDFLILPKACGWPWFDFFVLYLTQAMKTDGVILSCNTDSYNESVVTPKEVIGNFKM